MKVSKIVQKISLFVMVCIFSTVFFTQISRAKDDASLKSSAADLRQYFLDFENVPLGTIPDGWKIEATRQRGPLATWEVIEDDKAPSGQKVLALTRVNHDSGSTFNLCWTNKVEFLNGEISVRFKPVTGRIDQGGGIMWRVQDRNNYYVARFNPLEDNFRIYFVANGHRMMINSARVRLSSDRYHTMKIVQHDDTYECYLDGKRYLHGTDERFKSKGGVGLWTKADAATRFDDFKVELEK